MGYRGPSRALESLADSIRRLEHECNVGLPHPLDECRACLEAHKDRVRKDAMYREMEVWLR